MFDVNNAEKSLLKVFHRTKEAQQKQLPNGFDTLLSMIPRMHLSGRPKEQMMSGLTSLLTDTQVLEATKARVRETKKSLAAAQEGQTQHERAQVVPPSEAKSLTQSVIGKRTEREEVDMADESSQVIEKRLKVIEDSPNAQLKPP
jgi:hypothetical protein